MAYIPKERLLAEIEDIIRTMPPRDDLRGDSAWLGRALAAIENWNPSKSPTAAFFHYLFQADTGARADQYVNEFLALLHEARYDLLMQAPNAGTAVVPHGQVFEYFDAVRKIIELAKEDTLFVDPYLDAEFVSRYLPSVGPGVSIRLLAREKLSTLLPAVDTFTRQNGRKIEVRSAPHFHDRYLLVDHLSCYQSGASFKDGARSAPTTLTQIMDAFAAIAKTYEDLWSAAKIER